MPAGAALVGRDQPRRDWQIAIERVEAGRTAQPVVLYGLRGVGKTEKRAKTDESLSTGL